MRFARFAGLLALFTGLAVSLVFLRAEQTRCTSRILKAESRWVELRRDLWALQARTARLRSPHRVRELIERHDPDLVPPEESYPLTSKARLASDCR